MNEEIQMVDFRASNRIRKEWLDKIDDLILDNPDLFRNYADVARRGLVLVLKEHNKLK